MDARLKHPPFVFTGLPSAICGPYDDVVLPRDGEQPDWELELAAVIGRPARRVAVTEALDAVAGWVIVNDLTLRDKVFRREAGALGADWLAAKNAPTFLPAGPVIVPRSAIPDPGDLRMTLRLNGQVMQDESTRDMIFDVPRIIAHCSQVATLLPGDLVLTGSPAGNGLAHGRLLRPGDLMESTIAGLAPRPITAWRKDERYRASRRPARPHGRARGRGAHRRRARSRAAAAHRRRHGGRRLDDL